MTPIVIFAYNRPQHINNLLISLNKCSQIKKSKIYFFSDGSKRDEKKDLDKVKQVRKIIHQYALNKQNIKIIERKKNYGLFHNLLKGISQILKFEKKIIVLEDDLIVHQSFIEFLDAGLKKYQNSQKVLQISGYSYPIINLKKKAYFLELTSCWGWGITQSKWMEFTNFLKNKKKIKNIAKKILSNKKIKNKFNFKDSFKYSSFLQKQIDKQFNSWGILFYLFSFYKGYLTLFPNFSLVSNEGFDGSGIHKSSSSAFKYKLTNKKLTKSFPKKIELSLVNSLKVQKFLKNKFSFKRFFFSQFSKINIFNY